MRGALAGSLALIILYVAVQPGTSSKVAASGGPLIRGFQRFMSPTTAGIPTRAPRLPTAVAGQIVGNTLQQITVPGMGTG